MQTEHAFSIEGRGHKGFVTLSMLLTSAMSGVSYDCYISWGVKTRMAETDDANSLFHVMACG